MVQVDSTKVLKCANCLAVFYEERELLQEAGVVNSQMMYNTECPNCGTYDTMNEDFVGVPDKILKQYRDRKITFQEVKDSVDEELRETEKSNAKRADDF